MNPFFEKYKDYAMASQRVTGVPASITLSQAALESNYGKSLLSVQDNNFFGIKAGTKWIGDKSLWKTTEYIPISKKAYYKDYFSKDGRSIISIAPYNSVKEKWTVKDYFRKYKDAESSFTDHSQIYAVRKAKEIANGSTDYKVWANALKQSGYATDVNYPNKLINIIEQNKLFLLDEEATKKKMINASLFFAVSVLLTFGFYYFYEKNKFEANYKLYLTFGIGLFVGVFSYLLYLKMIDWFYLLQANENNI